MRGAKEFGSLRHLAVRFFTALWPAGPSSADESWARGWLVPGERQLWDRMSGPDRRHAVGVARGTLALLGVDSPTADRSVVASALLHDVGKVEAKLGTIARAFVTMVALVLGRSRLVAAPAAGRREPHWRRRTRLYLTHDRVGAALLEQAGSAGITVTWAREHHLDPSRWTVEHRVATALKAADGD